MRQLRKRQAFIKPSISRRDEFIKASYVQGLKMKEAE
jgi:hypothetical protein